MPLRQWTVDEVAHWLEDQGLCDQSEAFRTAEIDGEALALSTMENFQQLGMSMGKAIKLVKAVSQEAQGAMTPVPPAAASVSSSAMQESDDLVAEALAAAQPQPGPEADEVMALASKVIHDSNLKWLPAFLGKVEACAFVVFRHALHGSEMPTGRAGMVARTASEVVRLSVGSFISFFYQILMNKEWWSAMHRSACRAYDAEPAGGIRKYLAYAKVAAAFIWQTAKDIIDNVMEHHHFQLDEDAKREIRGLVDRMAGTIVPEISVTTYRAIAQR